MLTATFLGHQGWQFATRRSRILVDPLLVEPFGHGGTVGLVYPPRLLDVAKMAPVDAVILTHEHEDHFSIPSINRISRRIPIYVPERSSSALHRFLRHLGFTVLSISAGETLEIGNIQFVSFAADHIKRDELDEWDTLPFAVVDLDEGANFFSSVDVSPPASMEAALARLSGTPSLWCITNNVMNLGSMDCPQGSAPDPLLLASRLLADHARRFAPGSPPLATVFCGSGFSLTGDRAALNSIFFPLDSTNLAAAFRALRPDEHFIVPNPGSEISVVDGRLDASHGEAAFLKTAPADRWPDRKFAEPGRILPALNELDAAFCNQSVSEQELRALQDLLVEFAKYLYGTAMFRALYSLDSSALGEVKPTLAIRAISGEDTHIFEYNPQKCNFGLLDSDCSPTSYVIAFECFASDLLQVFRCRLPMSVIMFGRIRRWYVPAPDLRWALDRALWQYAHPLRHQDRYLESYIALFESEPADVPMVQAQRGLGA